MKFGVAQGQSGPSYDAYFEIQPAVPRKLRAIHPAFTARSLGKCLPYLTGQDNRGRHYERQVAAI